MNINFPTMDEGYIKEMVESGYYSNATELVRDAVRRLRESDAVKRERLMAAFYGRENRQSGKAALFLIRQNSWMIPKNARARISQKAKSPIRMSNLKNRIIFSFPAQKDVDDILAYTLENWGEEQLADYKAVLGKAFHTIGMFSGIWEIEEFGRSVTKT